MCKETYIMTYLSLLPTSQISIIRTINDLFTYPSDRPCEGKAQMGSYTCWEALSGSYTCWEAYLVHIHAIFCHMILSCMTFFIHFLLIISDLDVGSDKKKIHCYRNK